jgi:hypothetical protein
MSAFAWRMTVKLARLVRSGLILAALTATMILAAPLVGQSTGQDGRVTSGRPVPSGGDGTFYVGTYAKNVLVIDEATFTVRDTIPVTVGIPYRMALSANRQRIYVTEPNMEKVEVLDLAARRSLGQFTLSTPEKQVRIWAMNVDPRDRFAVLLVKTYVKKLDRWEIGPPRLLRFDLERRVVTDTIPWPQGQERENAQIIFSPDGASLYFFSADDVLVFDTQTLRQVDRWELGRTLFEEGVGRIGAGFNTDIYEEPGFYTQLFRVTDPVNRRALMGVARMDLMNRTMDWYPLGPSEQVSFSLAPGRQRAYGIHNEIGNYEFWAFDLANRRVESKVQFRGRPRMGLIVSSNGSQLYIGVAGSTIDRYDARTFQPLGTVDLRADMTRWILVPAAPPR